MVLAVFFLPAAKAQCPPSSSAKQTRRLPAIVMTATRIPEPAFDVTASISAVKIGGPDDDTPGVNAGWVLDTRRHQIAPYGRIDNPLDHSRIGSVIVNQSSGGSFEPVPGRSFWLGVDTTHRRF